MSTTVWVKRPAPVRVLLVSDIHGHYRDPLAWDLFEAFRRAWRPHRLVCLGDVCDFAVVSGHEDIDERADGAILVPEPAEVDYELDFGASVFARWRREHPAMTIDLLGGNHERMWARYIVRQAPALRASRHVNNLVEAFGLRGAAVDYVPYGTSRGLVLPYGPLGVWAYHGTRAGLSPARAELNLWHRPGISGHVHRLDRAGYRGLGREWIWWHSLPALCRLEPTGAWATHPAWNQGWGILEYWPDTNSVAVEMIRVEGPVLTWRDHTLTWEATPDPVASPNPGVAP